jgi:hypothetical protein
VAMQCDAHGACVGDDAGHVRGGREAADLQRAGGVAHQLALELGDVDVPVTVLANRHYLGDRLAPGQLVGVMLEGPDEHDRPFVGRNLCQQVIAGVEIGGQAQIEHLDQAVDGRGGAGAAEDDGVRVGRPDARPDERSGVLAEARRLEARARRLAVGIAIQRQDRRTQVVLDERQGTSRGGVVGVDHAAGPERAGDRLVVADDSRTDRRDEGCRGTVAGAASLHARRLRSSAPARRRAAP